MESKPRNTPQTRHRDALEAIREHGPSLLGPIERVDQGLARTNRVRLTELMTIDAMRGRFADARRWAHLAYVGSLAQIEETSRAFPAWPKAPLDDDQVPKVVETWAVDLCDGPAFHTLATRNPLEAKERGALGEGLRFALNARQLEFQRYLLGERGRGGRARLNGWTGALYFEALLPAHIIGDASLIRVAQGLREELRDSLKGVNTATMRTGRTAWEYPMGEELFAAIEAREPKKYKKAFAGIWDRSAKTSWWPHNISRKARLLALHLWAESKMGKPLALPGPAALRGFSADAYFLDAPSP